MNILAFIKPDLNSQKLITFIGYLCCIVLLLISFSVKNQANAGAYIFAGETNGIDIITHPSGYNGTGGPLTVGVCIDSTSVNAADMVIPVQNMVGTFNKLQAHSPNLSSGAANTTPSGAQDFESVALHELGHCLSLAHVNAATESGLGGTDRNYTKATNGADNVFNLNSGTDTIKGSKDDLRGDDVNLHWFNKATNNPCAIDDTIADMSTFSRAVADLPGTDNFVANADRDVCASLGLANTEAVMQQGSFSDDEQRRLTQDGVSTFKLGMTGSDETAGTADDYTVNVVSLGLVANPAANANCDIVIDFDNTETGFAVCQTSGVFLGGHVVINSAKIFFNTGSVWHFNDVLDSSIFCGGGLLDTDTNHNLNNQTITNEKRFKATQTITAGTAFNVSSTGCLSLAATTKITLESGFTVKTGAKFRAGIE